MKSSKSKRHEKASIYLSIYLLFAINGIAQVPSTIYSGKENVFQKYPQFLFSQAIAPQITMSSFDVNRLIEEDQQVKDKAVPFRFGKGFDVDITLNDGLWSEVDSGRIWSFAVASPGAYSLNFILDKLYLPEGAKIFIFNNQGTMVYGPVTSAQNLSRGLFLTDLVKGDQVYIHLFEPHNVAGQSQVHINKVVHAYYDLFKSLNTNTKESASCEVDVACYPDWLNESNAVALVLLSDGTTLCSGSLINNTAQDYRAYFLTAFHCIDDNKDHILQSSETYSASNWAFRFRYRRTTCWGSTIDNYFIYNQDDFRAAWDPSDFALVELVNSPLYDSRVTFLGWDRNGATPTQSTCIHQPMGDVTKIAIENNSATIYGTYFWQVTDWDIGTVEHGSSGAPFFNSSKRVVGQVSGGNNIFCSPNEISTYGRFSYSWTGGGTDLTRLSNWLDPCNTGSSTTNTIKGIEITGPDIVCTSNATFTLHNRPPGSTVSWSKSKFEPVYVSGQGTDQYTVRASSNDVKSSGFVKATISGPCGNIVTQKNIWIGRPGLPVTTPDGDPPMEVPYLSTFLVNIFDPPGADPSTGIWTANGSITITTGGHGGFCGFKATGFDYGQWHVHTSNNCGISDTYTGAVIVPTWKFGMQPNPADESLEITAEKRDYGTKGMVSDTYIIKIYNERETVVYENGPTSAPVLNISLRNFVPGVYFVHFTAGKQTDVKQLVVSH